MEKRRVPFSHSNSLWENVLDVKYDSLLDAAENSNFHGRTSLRLECLRGRGTYGKPTASSAKGGK
jgi:hypothetical protein